MGPTTACHLAKNLGVVLVKPDRHLTRIAVKTGYKSAERMCRTIAEVVGDSLSVIDIVIWRYATIAGSFEIEY
jgi:thermostable 8-oxoguanine DNA glycosylase